MGSNDRTQSHEPNPINTGQGSSLHRTWKKKADVIYHKYCILKVEELVQLELCKLGYKLTHQMLPTPASDALLMDHHDVCMVKLHQYNTRHKSVPNLPKVRNNKYRLFIRSCLCVFKTALRNLQYRMLGEFCKEMQGTHPKVNKLNGITTLNGITLPFNGVTIIKWHNIIVTISQFMEILPGDKQLVGI